MYKSYTMRRRSNGYAVKLELAQLERAVAVTARATARAPWAARAVIAHDAAKEALADYLIKNTGVGNERA